jgi:hypothetical protein
MHHKAPNVALENDQGGFAFARSIFSFFFDVRSLCAEPSRSKQKDKRTPVADEQQKEKRMNLRQTRFAAVVVELALALFPSESASDM